MGIGTRTTTDNSAIDTHNTDIKTIISQCQNRNTVTLLLLITSDIS